ncbi:PEP-CTERM sorting domain-containing protein [Neorhodopirellula lusitana]|uniref:PEP-CTERM sorting domain-containing protein n=1 Tax=Neorhodopirellula lusitana TaxID=445327 RepID=UPI00384AD077
MKKKFLGGLAALALMTGSASGEVIFSESFDNDTSFTTTATFFSDGTADYLGLAGGVNNWGGDSNPSGIKSYTGFTGGFLTGMDLNGEGGPNTVSLNWEGIDIAGKSGLSFSGDFAEILDVGSGPDTTDFLRVEAQLDGNGYETILEFGSDIVNGVFTLGSRGSVGFIPGAENISLGSETQNFSASIAGTGDLLDLRFTVKADAGSEDFAVDTFNVSAAAVPEPSSVALVALFAFGFGVNRRRRK